MIRIYSKIKKKKLLHIIFRKNNSLNRQNISPNEEFLQASYIPAKKNEHVKLHKHFWKMSRSKKIIVQEAWVIISGSVKIFLYDINDKLLSTEVLKTGDFSITFAGAHKFLSLSNKTQIYEFKTGPYEGQKKDLIYLE